MAHPYKSSAHKNDPAWLRGLDKHVEKATDADVTTVVRNYGSNKTETAKAAYEPRKEK